MRSLVHAKGTTSQGALCALRRRLYERHGRQVSLNDDVELIIDGKHSDYSVEMRDDMDYVASVELEWNVWHWLLRLLVGSCARVVEPDYYQLVSREKED